MDAKYKIEEKDGYFDLYEYEKDIDFWAFRTTSSSYYHAMQSMQNLIKGKNTPYFYDKNGALIES